PGAVEAPAQQEGGGDDGEGEYRGEARDGTAQRRHGQQQRRRGENQDFGHELGEETFHRASNGTYKRPKVNCLTRSARTGDIHAPATAVSSRGLGRSPLKAQTRVRIPLPLFAVPPPSSNGQDTTLSRWEQGFDSPWGHFLGVRSRGSR